MFRVKLSYFKLVKCDHMHSILFKYPKRLCLAYKLEENMAKKELFTLLMYD